MKGLLKMQEGGMDVPALQNRPRLNQWVSDYWQAFQYLGNSRTPHQAGIGPILLTEIVAYIDVICLRDIDERLKFIRMIQSLDNVYVTHVNERAQQRRKSEETKAKRAPRKR